MKLALEILGIWCLVSFVVGALVCAFFAGATSSYRHASRDVSWPEGRG